MVLKFMRKHNGSRSVFQHLMVHTQTLTISGSGTVTVPQVGTKNGNTYLAVEQWWRGQLSLASGHLT